ncbi:MAG: hypothetical protein ACYDEB_01745 [Dehalococcoidia bacterium]
MTRAAQAGAPRPEAAGRRIRRRAAPARVLVAALALAAAVVAACGGGAPGASGVVFPTVISLGGCDVCPAVRNTTLAVGPNRVVLGLEDAGQRPILDAQVHVRFYDLTGKKPVFSSEADATFEPVQLSYVNEEAHNQTTVTGHDGVYVAYATFDRSGTWGVQMDVTRNGKKLKPIPYTFTVLDKAPEPAIGDAAPASRQITLANVSDISEIDSSFPPRPAMHEITVADALKTGKPIVVAFATPAFCTSRTCGPIMDTVMDPLAAKYAGQAIFIHIEPYDLRALRDTGQQIPVPAMRQWGLQSEPWIFVIDRQGKIAAKYEGIASAAEVGQALERVLAEAPGGAAGTPAVASTP